jgi:hypothetical protein
LIVGPLSQIECEWIDPYFGIFKFKGKEGFVMTKQIPADLDIVMPAPVSTDDVSAATEKNDD